jgi:hypothetical protein
MRGRRRKIAAAAAVVVVVLVLQFLEYLTIKVQFLSTIIF